MAFSFYASVMLAVYRPFGAANVDAATRPDVPGCLPRFPPAVLAFSFFASTLSMMSERPRTDPSGIPLEPVYGPADRAG